MCQGPNVEVQEQFISQFSLYTLGTGVHTQVIGLLQQIHLLAKHFAALTVLLFLSVMACGRGQESDRQVNDQI